VQHRPTLRRVAKREEHLQRPSQLLVGIVHNERRGKTILPGCTLAPVILMSSSCEAGSAPTAARIVA
jgi:hypothetical protein